MKHLLTGCCLSAMLLIVLVFGVAEFIAWIVTSVVRAVGG